MPDDYGQNESAKSNLPKLGASIQLQHCQIQIGYFPPIQLGIKQNAQKFGLSLCDYLSVEKQEFESHKWDFVASFSASSECQVQITIVPHQLMLNLRVLANQPQELIENRFHFVLEKFAANFTPQVLLGLNISTVGIMEIDGDARIFLQQNLMRVDPHRLRLFGRPLHMIGLHFMFPPFSIPGEGGKTMEWAGDVKIESLMTDPSKLFLGATATWADAMQWLPTVPQEVINRLTIATDYFRGCVAEFVGNLPDHSSGDQL